ncbi:hypothetical protein NDU88_008020 [Pleurodeles waltl]|uniref:Uncharacterized protein n=1 Tax=Pleurodeles waltl TaxID=8319 RepID=A0AAV7RSK9_PLEWA|nr:hypothetical protein NDU88_008020 [Pleurodeles waltl]
MIVAPEPGCLARNRMHLFPAFGSLCEAGLEMDCRLETLRVGVQSFAVWAEATDNVCRGRRCLIRCSPHGPHVVDFLAVWRNEKESSARCKLYLATREGKCVYMTPA